MCTRFLLVLFVFSTTMSTSCVSICLTYFVKLRTCFSRPDFTWEFCYRIYEKTFGVFTWNNIIWRWNIPHMWSGLYVRGQKKNQIIRWTIKFVIHCKPFNENRISLCPHSHRENPVFNTGNPVLIAGIFLLPCSTLYGIAV